ncbi:MAG: hypothetical protein ACRDXB_05785, partial [Actinomycetes bacterium]
MTGHDAAGLRQDDRWTAQVATIDELEPRTAYEVWRLRQDVFVVEQECAYPDLDGRDAEPTAR